MSLQPEQDLISSTLTRRLRNSQDQSDQQSADILIPRLRSSVDQLFDAHFQPEAVEPQIRYHLVGDYRTPSEVLLCRIPVHEVEDGAPPIEVSLGRNGLIYQIDVHEQPYILQLDDKRAELRSRERVSPISPGEAVLGRYYRSYPAQTEQANLESMQYYLQLCEQQIPHPETTFESREEYREL